MARHPLPATVDCRPIAIDPYRVCIRLRRAIALDHRRRRLRLHHVALVDGHRRRRLIIGLLRCDLLLLLRVLLLRVLLLRHLLLLLLRELLVLNRLLLRILLLLRRNRLLLRNLLLLSDGVRIVVLNRQCLPSLRLLVNGASSQGKAEKNCDSDCSRHRRKPFVSNSNAPQKRARPQQAGDSTRFALCFERASRPRYSNRPFQIRARMNETSFFCGSCAQTSLACGVSACSPSRRVERTPCQISKSFDDRND